MKDINSLYNLIRQTSYDIHVYHGHGHLEKVYDEDDTLIGDYFADILVDNHLILELKTAKNLCMCMKLKF